MKIKKKMTHGKVTITKVKGALHEEKEAIKDYRRDAKRVDPQTAKLFRHIASEESHHKTELNKRLTAIKKG
jgi:rubrerythrin